MCETAYAGSRDRLMAQLYLLSNRLGMLLPYPSGDASGGESTPAPPERTEPATR